MKGRFENSAIWFFLFALAGSVGLACGGEGKGSDPVDAAVQSDAADGADAAPADADIGDDATVGPDAAVIPEGTCSDPIDLEAHGTQGADGFIRFSGSTVGASDDAHSVCPAGTGGADRIFVLNPTESGVLEARLEANTFDALLYLLDDCTGSATDLAFDLYPPGSGVRIDLFAPAATYVVVDGATAADTGDIALAARFTPFIQDGQPCDPAVDLPGCQPPLVCAGTNPNETCRPAACGDGRIDGLESCDDGNTTPGDLCSDTCVVEDLGLPIGDRETPEDTAARMGMEVMTHTAWLANNPNGETKRLLVKDPPTAGPHPVFIFAVGTGGVVNATIALAFVEEMAAAGFVAASMEYNNGARLACADLEQKAEWAYSSGMMNSAANVLCSRAAADCSLGIVTAGHSQGSFVSVLASNYNANVRAAYALGTMTDVMGIFDISACMTGPAQGGTRVLPDDRIMGVTGENDVPAGGIVPDVQHIRDQLNAITNLACPSGYGCLRCDGSGWHIVENSAVDDGIAHHSYFCWDEGSSGAPRLSAIAAGLDPISVHIQTKYLRDYYLPWGLKRAARFLTLHTD